MQQLRQQREADQGPEEAPEALRRAPARGGVPAWADAAAPGPLARGAPGLQRKAAPGAEAEEAAEASPATTATPAGLIVADEAPGELMPGQLRRSEFLALLRDRVCATAAAALADTMWAPLGCPYIERWFDYYSGRDAAHIERALLRYTPEAARATDARDYVPIVCERVHAGIETWRDTGRIEGVPEDASATPPGETPPGEAGAPPAESGTTGSLMPKGEEGAGRTASPVAVQARLGQGQPLDGGLRGRMEGALGVGLGGVRVHTDAGAAGLAYGLRARAFTVGEHVAFAGGEYRPGTPAGDALIAHELAHVTQQRGGALTGGASDRTLEEDADRSAVVAALRLWGGAQALAGRTLPALRSGLRLQRCDSCNPSPSTTTTPATGAGGGVRFSQLQSNWPTLTTQTARDAALNPAIADARRRASHLFRNAGSDPIRAIRERINRETGTDLEANPFIGVSQDSVERAYRAWAEGAGVDPWVLLGLWKKEGIGESVANTVAATTADRARAIYRSQVYYLQMGLDHFMHTSASSGDNLASFTDADAPQHDTTFQSAVRAQVSAGRLARDISGEINAALTVTPAGAGQFQVTPTSQFYTLSLLLAGAYYRENAEALATDARIGANPDPGLVYMRWNMGGTRFRPFVPSAESHRMEAQYDMPGGRHPTLAQWAFERTPLENEWGQARRNAIRFRYFTEVFRLAYEGW
jgi:hypothetical protein